MSQKKDNNLQFLTNVSESIWSCRKFQLATVQVFRLFRPIFVICLKIITQVIISHDYDKFAAPLIYSDVHIVVNDIAKFLFVCVILL